ncbi:DUF3817 domain-containing protein [Dermacoccus sp. 147Ba]|uniref:DUF3817 domain-containing protein n=1 Tax=Dermacoccus sp. 147Ba TaxID=2510111 RepID=UPI00101D9850|nr:DUF3817 domain-containing protein [Dermacoccus sp. 147Ba]RYI22830.1 DUF3817 domain-containing protein [Dermacoccus sp. 147Ba]
MTDQKPAAAGKPTIDVNQARSALKFFKIAAFIVGIGLLVLVLEMVLHYRFHNDALAWWPQPHGLLFLVYVATTANLGFKMRWGLGKMVLVILAGCVPFLSFWVERKMSREVEADLAGR